MLAFGRPTPGNSGSSLAVAAVPALAAAVMSAALERIKSYATGTAELVPANDDTSPPGPNSPSLLLGIAVLWVIFISSSLAAFYLIWTQPQKPG